eukprot:scaffold178103_cov45-Prasinocladus_malaysianus.AAC.2
MSQLELGGGTAEAALRCHRSPAVRRGTRGKLPLCVVSIQGVNIARLATYKPALGALKPNVNIRCAIATRQQLRVPPHPNAEST